MANKYPKDRFDAVPDNLQRVGAHRAPRAKGRGWIGFAWAALATAILIGIGVIGLFAVNSGINLPGGLGGAPTPTPTPTSTPTPTIVPTVDPSLNLTVLNGTTTTGLATSVGDTLVKAGWKVGARGNASATNITKTVVYYSDPKNQAAALGVAQSLPGAPVAMTQDFAVSGADITVVVGSDYKPAQ
ncbi:MAG: hypothetical protein QOJ77_2323 [Microbacteriaceae bacterium]|nr:hypothetical protein [Microbacteriaceae bacterium]